MFDSKKTIHIVGAGLAGSECAYQLAEKGYSVVLYEMRAKKKTPAHKTHLMAELVCSNSFGSQTEYSAPGQLKWEAEQRASLILESAKKAAIPAGMALGVDRNLFSKYIDEKVRNHPNVKVEDKIVESLDEVPRPAIIATGPLTEEKFAKSLQAHFEQGFLYFYDAIAPIIDTESINMDICWKADRWDKGTKDYINCPLDKEQYYRLINEINSADKVESKEFEMISCFEGCMPVEDIVKRGDETLRFGPLSPKGLRHPETAEKYYAVVQLRQENKQATAYNMVGFQTKMTYSEQKRVFRMIPGLEEAEFLKLGSIHKNLFIHTPKMLTHYLSSHRDPDLFFAGQITGVEGYFESTCIGLLVADFMDQKLSKGSITLPNRYSAFGSLLNAITEDKEEFQPTNMNFSLFPKVEDNSMRGRRSREQRRDRQIQLARQSYLN